MKPYVYFSTVIKSIRFILREFQLNLPESRGVAGTELLRTTRTIIKNSGISNSIKVKPYNKQQRKIIPSLKDEVKSLGRNIKNKYQF